MMYVYAAGPSSLTIAYVLVVCALAIASASVNEIGESFPPDCACGVQTACAEHNLSNRERSFGDITRSTVQLLKQQIIDSQNFAKVLYRTNQQLGLLERDPQIRSAIIMLTKENGRLHKNLLDVSERLENARSQVELLRSNLACAEELASRDALTNLGNRRCFDSTLAAEMERALATGRELCLALGDIDNFKRINDDFGHLVGDNALRLVGQLIQKKSNREDLLARFGGDEFALILPGKCLIEAGDAVERIRSQVETKRWAMIGGGEQLGAITISFGVAAFTPGDAPDEIIARADASLYRAKHLGKNRVVVEARSGYRTLWRERLVQSEVESHGLPRRV